MAKKKMTTAQHKRVKKQAERLKDVGMEKDRAFAIATSQVKKGQRAGYKKKSGK